MTKKMTKKIRKQDRYAIIDENGKIKDTFRSILTAVNMLSKINTPPREDLKIVKIEDIGKE